MAMIIVLRSAWLWYTSKQTDIQEVLSENIVKYY